MVMLLRVRIMRVAVGRWEEGRRPVGSGVYVERARARVMGVEVGAGLCGSVLVVMDLEVMAFFSSMVYAMSTTWSCGGVVSRFAPSANVPYVPAIWDGDATNSSAGREEGKVFVFATTEG
jgi:hypothetical protein